MSSDSSGVVWKGCGKCGEAFADVFSACDFFFVDEQQEFISKAKDTIAAATEKCKDVENKMKV